MTAIAGRLSVEALRERYVTSVDVCEARHFRTIWLLAKGRKRRRRRRTTSLGRRWIEQLVVRYKKGSDSLGDLRRRHGSAARLLKSDVVEKLRGRLKEPPSDGAFVDERQGRGLFQRRNNKETQRNLILWKFPRLKIDADPSPVR